jgi:YVTN family beta-propeller protein
LGIDITPDGSRIYTASRSNSVVYVIDTNTNSVLTSIQLSINPSTSFTSLAISPDRDIGYVSYQNSDSLLAIIDTDPVSPTYNQEIGTIMTTSDSLTRIDFTEDRKNAFIAGWGNDELLVLDSDKNSFTYNKQIGVVKVGDKPFGVTFQPLSVAIAYGTVSVIDNNIVGIKQVFHEVPTVFKLYQNYPNPFNPETMIEYRLPEAGYVKLKIYTLLGEEVRMLVNEEREAGYHKILWDGTDNSGLRLSSGMYLYRIQVGEFIQMKKLI